MRKRLLVAGALALCGVLAANATAQDSVLARELVRLGDLLVGDFDNQEQVYFQGELEVAESERHQRVRQVVDRAETGDSSDRIYVWTRYVDESDTPAAIGLWRLSVDEDAGAIRMQRWQLPLQADLERAALAPETIGTPGCDIAWQRRAGQFFGAVVGDACSDGNDAAGWLVAESELQLPTSSAGDATPIAAPYIMRRSRPFRCWVAVPKRDGERWHFENQLALHDQGGRVWVDTDEPEPQRVGIKMRNVVWPTGTNRDSLVLYVYRGDESSAASYAWGEPTAKRLAINLRWMQASCTLEE